MANQPSAGSERFARAVQAIGIGERLAILGAAGVLATWFGFDLLLAEYGVGHLPFALSALTLFLAYRFHVQRAPHWSVDYRTLVVVLAGLIGLLGLQELLIDLRYEVFDRDAATILGAIAFWAAAFVAGAGALRMAR
ncbi:MAG: hypothetical protein AB7F65_04995 [Dehalococcoidia bacterium]